SATSRASLTGSFSGASASGYFALPITSAKRSPAAMDRVGDAIEKISVASKARRIFIIAANPDRGIPMEMAPLSACAPGTLL
ncbi:hypothetical protein CEE87_12810, partial [Lactobacillus crispatus]